MMMMMMEGLRKKPNMFHNYETKKITREASDAAENLQLYRVVPENGSDYSLLPGARTGPT